MFFNKKLKNVSDNKTNTRVPFIGRRISILAVLLFAILATLSPKGFSQNFLAFQSSVLSSIGMIQQNQPPAITITSPSEGATFAEPGSVTVTATTSDSDGQVSSVIFYIFRNGTTWGEAWNAPNPASGTHTHTFSNLLPGTYKIRIVAQDNLGASTTSPDRTITVTRSGANTPPVVTITSPNGGATFAEPGSVTVSFTATDDQRVDFVNLYIFRNGTSWGSAWGSPNVASGTYTHTFNNLLPGTYRIQARATDNQGALTISEDRTITVTRNGTNAPPVITINSPNEGANFAAPANISVSASVTDDQRVDVVIIYIFRSGWIDSWGSTNLASGVYARTFNNLPAGTYSIRVVALDNQGESTTSPDRTITISANAPTTVQSISVEPNSLMGGTGKVFGTVTLTSPALLGGQAIRLTSSSALVGMPSYVVVPQGQTTITFPIQAKEVTANQTATLGAAFHNETPKTATLTILPQSGPIIADDGPGPSTPTSPSLSVTPLTDSQQGSTALQALVQKIVGPGVQVVNPASIRFTGSASAAGQFSGGTGIIGFEDGIILGSGEAVNVIGPNNSSDKTTNLGTSGDRWLTYLAFGAPTLDATILEFDIIPSSNILKFQYVFSSDEYNEWANTVFNDVFGFFIDKENIGVIPGTDIPVSVNTVNNGNPGEDIRPHYAHLYIDNERTVAPVNTQMDGLTTVLTAKTYVTPGKVTHVRLAIADTGDSALDSNVFLRAGSLSSVGGLLPPTPTSQSKIIHRVNDCVEPYTSPLITSPSLSSNSNRSASFDFAGLQGGLIVSGHIARPGSLAFTTGRYDNEWGIRSGLDSTLVSYGSYAELEGQSSPRTYNLGWFLPLDFYPDMQLGGAAGGATDSCGAGVIVGNAPVSIPQRSANTLRSNNAPPQVPTHVGGTKAGLPPRYQMLLTDRILSPLDSSWSVTDTPQANNTRNKLTILVQPNGNPQVKHGTSLDITIPAALPAPLSGWVIQRGSTVYASSANPNGWSVIADDTVYGGVIISAPTGLLTKRNLVIYFNNGNRAGAGRFDLIGTDGDGVGIDPPPSAPILTATPVSQNQINLTWTDPNQDELGVVVERKKSDGTWERIASLEPNITSHPDTGLTKDTLYLYRVRAYNEVGDSAYSNEAAAKTFGDPIAGAPTNLVAVAVSDVQINLTWTDNCNTETGFKIQRKTVDDPSWKDAGTVGQNITSFQSTGLSPSTLYTYRVYGYNASGSTDPSNDASATTFAVQPPNGAPTNLIAETISASQINLRWTDNTSNEAGFRIERKTEDSSSWDQAGMVGANVTTFPNTGLTSDTTYTYRVRAYNDAGNSAPSNEALATTLSNTNGGSPAPEGIYLKDLTLSRLGIKDSGIDNKSIITVELNRATSIDVRVLLGHNAPSAISIPQGVVVKAGKTKASCLLTGVSSGGTVEGTDVIVRGNAGGFIQGAHVVVMPANFSPTMTNLRGFGGNNCVVLTWDAMPDLSVRGYRVLRRRNGVVTEVTDSIQTAAEVADMEINASTEYQVRIVQWSGVEVPSSWITVAQKTNVAALEWNSMPSTASGILSIKASIVASGTLPDDVYLLIDGQNVGSVYSRNSSATDLDNFLEIQYSLDTAEYSNGNHTIQLVGGSSKIYGFASTPLNIDFNNQFSSYYAGGIFNPLRGEIAGMTVNLPVGTTNWTINITNDRTGDIVKQWSGNGRLAQVAWDGIKNDGFMVEDESEEEYSINLMQANQVNTGNHRPIKPQKYSPDGLALISQISTKRVGGVDVLVPEFDEQLRDIVTHAFKNWKQVKSGFTYRVLYAPDYKANKYGGPKGLRRTIFEMMTHARYFYLFGHGSRTPSGNPYSHAENRVYWGNGKNPDGLGFQSYAGGSYFHNTDDGVINMDDVMLWRGKYNFAFIDTCWSAGFNTGEGDFYFEKPGSQLRNGNDWARAMKMDGGDDTELNVFMGWDGEMYVNSLHNGNESAWSIWRKKFWGEAGGPTGGSGATIDLCIAKALQELSRRNFNSTAPKMPGEVYAGFPRLYVWPKTHSMQFILPWQ
jgi:Bacterial Ig domain/Fibronectin type III domain